MTAKIYKFAITGGHHNSALVLAQKLRDMGHEVDWIGHRYAAAGDTHDSAEYTEVRALEFPFHELNAGKTSFSPRNLVRLPLGLIRAQKILQTLRPDAVISFGGYLGFNASIAALSLGIPVYLHEQTVIAGKANKLTAAFARKVFLTWETSREYYPSQKIEHVGLPLRQAFIHPENKPLFKGNLPTLLILCGKQGSHTVNNLIFRHLEEFLKNYNLLHQTGTSSATGDYERAVALKDTLPSDLPGKYQPFGYISEQDTAKFMAACDVFIGRSGAHTAYELGILGKKAVLIPLMTTHGKEQLKNARLLAQAGIATILPQSELSYPSLQQAINRMFVAAFPEPLDLPKNAASIMAERIIADLASLHEKQHA